MNENEQFWKFIEPDKRKMLDFENTSTMLLWWMRNFVDVVFKGVRYENRFMTEIAKSSNIYQTRFFASHALRLFWWKFNKKLTLFTKASILN